LNGVSPSQRPILREQLLDRGLPDKLLGPRQAGGRQLGAEGRVGQGPRQGIRQRRDIGWVDEQRCEISQGSTLQRHSYDLAGDGGFDLTSGTQTPTRSYNAVPDQLGSPSTVPTASATLYRELRCGPWGRSATPAAARRRNASNSW
jgi:hypothetical protein